jgi:hypothetical protein
MPASDTIKKSLATYVKLSQANFLNVTNLNKTYIAEVIEYGLNPFQIVNTNKIAANIMEVTLFNLNKTVTETSIYKVDIKNLTVPIEFAFPAADN